ncbi:MAG: hypothetical protein RLZZ316_629 [Bacteroidota bacterium]
MKKLTVACITLCIAWAANAQLDHKIKPLNQQDTLRGAITAERAWWNVQHYAITVNPDFATKTISGSNNIRFKAIAAGSTMQIDLQGVLQIDSIAILYTNPQTKDKKWNADIKKDLTRNGNAWYIHTPGGFEINQNYTLTIYYHGKPKEALRAPWDGGWIWKKDQNNNPWMSVACQGLGASVWYPCKDHQSDEPDNGATLTIIVPDTLTAVGNGRLANKKRMGNGTTAWIWEVTNPINNYNIIPYIGKYTNFTETYIGETEKNLQLSYWVLNYNETKAKEQFKQVVPMLQCFEKWFGPYPFYEDGFKLVESPHLGMEHQSAVAYGNQFKNGYLGRDLSGTGWGLKWDFIIIHESGHEWFGNNITSKDLADMWIHESFTNYSETIYTQCQFGIEAGNDYVIGTRNNIANDIPIIAPYNVNREGSGDMYYKGGNMIHTIRQIVNNDEKFRQILRGLNKTFYHQTVTTQQVETYISKQSDINFSKVFDQYLRSTQIPVLEYKIKGSTVTYRFKNCLPGFTMPVKFFAGKEQWLKPTQKWQSTRFADWFDAKQFKIDRNFYIETKKL